MFSKCDPNFLGLAFNANQKSCFRNDRQSQIANKCTASATLMLELQATKQKYQNEKTDFMFKVKLQRA